MKYVYTNVSSGQKTKISSYVYSELLDHIVYYICVSFYNIGHDQSLQISIPMDQEGTEAITTIY